MPIYTYQCYECGLIQEVMRSVNKRDNPHACEHCLCICERIIDLAAFQLKGSGWYKDGYSNKKQKEKKESESTENS